MLWQAWHPSDVELADQRLRDRNAEVRRLGRMGLRVRGKGWCRP